MSHLFEKYNQPAPRYTSYPAVPYWKNDVNESKWLNHLNDEFSKQQLIWSMYVHIPFCKTLCHYCGCNRQIQKSKTLNKPYIDLLKKELDIYTKNIQDVKKHPLKSLHFGGGTPTFLSSDELAETVDYLQAHINFAPDFEGSIEVDPRTTKEQQLKVLFDRGFKRVSLGVQDFNPQVQQLINRIQTFEVTADITNMARRIGYESINFDLIYGLPGQGMQEIKHTIDRTMELKPDRIALYSLALVPWFSPSQRNFKDSDLPDPIVKRELYETSRQLLIDAGYVEIGMDHFALADEKLAIAKTDKTLHRNFMGYTEQNYELMLGLGVSSISESSGMYFQNLKSYEDYESSLNKGLLPYFNGHTLTRDELSIKQQILNLTTQYEVSLSTDQVKESTPGLQTYIDDKLCEISNNKLSITTLGEPFLRNICAQIDPFIIHGKKASRQFSKTI